MGKIFRQLIAIILIMVAVYALLMWIVSSPWLIWGVDSIAMTNTSWLALAGLSLGFAYSIDSGLTQKVVGGVLDGVGYIATRAAQITGEVVGSGASSLLKSAGGVLLLGFGLFVGYKLITSGTSKKQSDQSYEITSKSIQVSPENPELSGNRSIARHHLVDGTIMEISQKGGVSYSQAPSTEAALIQANTIAERYI